jgi:hypothetical protein
MGVKPRRARARVRLHRDIGDVGDIDDIGKVGKAFWPQPPAKTLQKDEEPKFTPTLASNFN